MKIIPYMASTYDHDIYCPHCYRELDLDFEGEEENGKFEVKCPNCRKIFLLEVWVKLAYRVVSKQEQAQVERLKALSG